MWYLQLVSYSILYDKLGKNLSGIDVIMQLSDSISVPLILLAEKEKNFEDDSSRWNM